MLISHNGPRSAKGGRESYPVADVNLHMGEVERWTAGQTYTMNPLQYHHTPCEGVVITLMSKGEELDIHANSVCQRGIDFHYDFDRFQISPDDLFDIVKDALLWELP